MIPRKLKVGIARFPYAGNGGAQAEHPAVGTWLTQTVADILRDPRCEPEVWQKPYCDTPITMTRNAALAEARAKGVDLLVMVDSDQVPDFHVGTDPLAKRFWDSSFPFVYDHWPKGPCIVAAPYCGPPPDPRAPDEVGNPWAAQPEEKVFAFLWEASRNDPDTRRLRLRGLTRDEAATRAGMERVAAAATGLIVIDTRVVEPERGLKVPWFDYEWTDRFRTQKASTEDVYFTRNCALIGIPVYVNWDAWAGHAKQEIVGKPAVVTVEEVGDWLSEWARKGHHAGERQVELNADKSVAEILEEMGLDVPVRVCDPATDSTPEGLFREMANAAPPRAEPLFFDPPADPVQAARVAAGRAIFINRQECPVPSEVLANAGLLYGEPPKQEPEPCPPS